MLVLYIIQWNEYKSYKYNLLFLYFLMIKEFYESYFSLKI